MAKDEEGLRKDLELAQRVVVLARRNFLEAPPELVAYWRHELEEAEAEVARLKRELKL